MSRVADRTAARVALAQLLSLELVLIVASYVAAIVVLTRGFLADLHDLRTRSVA